MLVIESCELGHSPNTASSLIIGIIISPPLSPPPFVFRRYKAIDKLTS